jgi:hypothetical protein
MVQTSNLSKFSTLVNNMTCKVNLLIPLTKLSIIDRHWPSIIPKEGTINVNIMELFLGKVDYENNGVDTLM